MSIAEPRTGAPRTRARPYSRSSSGVTPRWWERLGTTGHLLAWAALAVLLRLPYVGMPMTPDEAGFSIVARQWSHGPSLYGHYWVDRPPLLIELFDLGGRLGTPVGLRLLGCLAAFAATLLVGVCARSAAGRRAGFWAAAVAAVGFSSPVLGALPVNGELLAAPFIAGSICCWVVSATRPRPHHVLVAVSGALAAAAVLVKQNMVDAVLFVAVAAVLETVWRHRARRTARVMAVWAGGAVAACVAVLGLAVARGSSISGIWYAMYPFRLQVRNTIQGASLQTHLVALAHLGTLELLTLGPVLLAVLAWVLARDRRVRIFEVRVVAPAVLLVAAYGVFSVVAGGSYWTHYLVQLVVPTALAGGLVASRRPRLGQPLAAAVVAVALLLALVAPTRTSQDHAGAIGDAIADVSQPGDTVVSALGDADIVQATGLRSDYTYLWSLPARTLDPRFTRLAALLSGPDAPTWLVVRGLRTDHTLLTTAPGPVLGAHYRVVSHLCGRIVYVNNDVDRRTPVDPAVCAFG